MRLLYLGCFFLSLFSTAVFAGVTVHYDVRPRPENQDVVISATVTGLESGKRLSLAITEHYASVKDFYKDIQDISLPGTPANEFMACPPPSQANEWCLKNPMGSNTFHYSYRVRVQQKLPNELFEFRPSLNKEGYYSNGYPIFVYPKRYPDRDITVEQFTVGFDLPSGWHAITSFVERATIWYASSLHALLNSSIALGKYRQASYQLPNKATLKVAINGSWHFSDEEFGLVAAKIIGAQIEIMKSWASPTYLVTLSQSAKPDSMSGSGLENAFEMFAPASTTLDRLLFLISHETFHYWNGHRIRYKGPENRWFSEGFTNYYTYLVIGRMRLWDLPSILAKASTEMQGYFENPLKTEINFADAGKYFWEWTEYGYLPYTKGALIALMIDVHMRTLSDNKKTLDDFMRLIDSELGGTEQPIDDNGFFERLERYTEMSWNNFQQQYVSGKVLLPVNDFIRAGGMEIVGKSCTRAELGLVLIPNFDPEGTPHGYRASHVISEGPAFQAGIRENDVIVKWSINKKPNARVKLGVLEKSGSIVFHEYLSGAITTTCEYLDFAETTNPLAIAIRNDIWKIDSGKFYWSVAHDLLRSN